MSRLIGLYSAPWRARYEAELRSILEERPPSWGDRLDLIRGALDARLHPELVEPGVPDLEMAPESRAPGIAAIAGGISWALLSIVVGRMAMRTSDVDVTALFWMSLFFMTISLIGPVPAARSRQIRRGLIASGILLGLGLFLPWDLKGVPFVSLVALVGAGLLTLACLRAGLRALARVAVVGLAWVVPFGIAGLGSMGFIDLGPGTDWVQGVVAAPFGVAWIILGALTVRRGRIASMGDGSAATTTKAVAG